MTWTGSFLPRNSLIPTSIRLWTEQSEPYNAAIAPVHAAGCKRSVYCAKCSAGWRRNCHEQWGNPAQGTEDTCCIAVRGKCKILKRSYTWLSVRTLGDKNNLGPAVMLLLVCNLYVEQHHFLRNCLRSYIFALNMALCRTQLDYADAKEISLETRNGQSAVVRSRRA